MRAWLPLSNANRALSEIALSDLHIDARRHFGGERGVEGRTELVDRLDPEAFSAARLDDLLVTRVVEGRGNGALGAVDLDLPAADLRPAGVVADDGDHGD